MVDLNLSTVVSVTLAIALIVGIIGIRKLSSNIFKLYQAGLRTQDSLSAAEKLAGIGSWSIDVSNQALHWSPRVFEIHKRNPELGPPDLQNAIDCYHPDDRQRVTEAVGMAMRHAEEFEFTARLVFADGTETHVVTRGMCQTDVSGDVIAVYGIFIETAHVIKMAESINDNMQEYRSNCM